MAFATLACSVYVTEKDQSQVIPETVRKTYNLFKATIEYLYHFLQESPPELPQDTNSLLEYKDELVDIAKRAIQKAHAIGFPGKDKTQKASAFKKWCHDNASILPSGLSNEEYIKAKSLNHIPDDFKTPELVQKRKRKLQQCIDN